MNTITLIGNLTRDAEIQTLNNGTTLGKFTLAVKRPYNKDATDFLDCVCFNKVADIIKQYTQKGDKIGITGYIQRREYDAQDGTKKAVVDIVANDVEFLNTKGKQEQPAENKPQQTQVELKPIDYDTDLPF